MALLVLGKVNEGVFLVEFVVVLFGEIFAVLMMNVENFLFVPAPFLGVGVGVRVGMGSQKFVMFFEDELFGEGGFFGGHESIIKGES